MANHSSGMHHFHVRKRMKNKKREKPGKWKALMDRFIYVVGIAGPVMTLPQLSEIWLYKNTAGVSAITWTAYLIAAVFWMIYGIMHKDKLLIFTYALWIFLDFFIVAGTIIF